MSGQPRDRHTGGGAVGQRYRLAERSAVHKVCRPVLRVERPVIAGAVGVVRVEVLEAEGVGVIRDQLVICRVIPHIQSRHLRGGEGGAVAPVLELVVIDVRHVPYVLVVFVIRSVIGIVDRDEGGRVLHVYQIVLVRAVVDGDEEGAPMYTVEPLRWVPS